MNMDKFTEQFVGVFTEGNAATVEISHHPEAIERVYSTIQAERRLRQQRNIKKEVSTVYIGQELLRMVKATPAQHSMATALMRVPATVSPSGLTVFNLKVLIVLDDYMHIGVA